MVGDMINELNIFLEIKEVYNNIILVLYVVIYIFGMVGFVWVLGLFGLWLLGGFDKVKVVCKELEVKMGNNEVD